MKLRGEKKIHCNFWRRKGSEIIVLPNCYSSWARLDFRTCRNQPVCPWSKPCALPLSRQLYLSTCALLVRASCSLTAKCGLLWATHLGEDSLPLARGSLQSWKKPSRTLVDRPLTLLHLCRRWIPQPRKASCLPASEEESALTLTQTKNGLTLTL